MTDTRRDSIGAAAPDVDGEWDGVGLPMPRNLSLLDPDAPRLRVRTVAERFPFPIPNGWFIVAMAGDIAAGESQALHYFGRDLVLYRTDDGLPHT